MQEELTGAEVAAIIRGEHVPKRPAAQSHSLNPLTITIPLPPKAVSPNARAHWAAKAKAAKKQKYDAWIASLAALDGLGVSPPFWIRATIKATFYKGGNQAKLADADNLIGSLKSAADGLQEAGIVLNDRGITWLPIAQVIGRDVSGRSRVELIVTPISHDPLTPNDQ